MVVEEWPEAKIVFMKRRGIENVMSALWKFPGLTFEASCHAWTEAMAAWAALGPVVKASSIEIDQAEMAREPHRTADRLGGFLGLNETAIIRVVEAFGRKAHPRSNSRVSSMEELQRDPIPLAETSWSEASVPPSSQSAANTTGLYGYPLN